MFLNQILGDSHLVGIVDVESRGKLGIKMPFIGGLGLLFDEPLLFSH